MSGSTYRRTSWLALLHEQRGGAVVELAVFTFAFVPLAMYGLWFSDCLHFAIRAQEASILPAWDVTAKLLHDEANGSSSLSKISSATSTAQSDVLNDMQNSFDSTDPLGSPVKQSVVARAGSLQVACQPSSGTGASPDNSIAWMSGAVHADDSRLPVNTWINCSSKLTLTTSGIPAEYAEDRAAGVQLFPSAWTSLDLCGIGPGVTGCATGTNSGFFLFTDDWACENGSANQLSIGSSGGNDAYFNVAQEFYSAAGNPSSVLEIMTGWGDLAPSTDSFRLTYQRTTGGAYSQTEDGHQQSSPHGGASSLHTGGPWHDEGMPYHAGELTFSARANSTYMAVPGWPSD
jgi:hypothetical protein